MGIRHLPHVLSVPPTKACLLCATPAGMDLYRQAMPVGTYRVQSPGFPKIVYFSTDFQGLVHSAENGRSFSTNMQLWSTTHSSWLVQKTRRHLLDKAWTQGHWYPPPPNKKSDPGGITMQKTWVYIPEPFKLLAMSLFQKLSVLKQQSNSKLSSCSHSQSICFWPKNHHRCFQLLSNWN